jgi:hypothetical protein
MLMAHTGDSVVRIDRRTRISIAIYMSVVAGLFIFVAALSLLGVVHNRTPPSTTVGIAIAALTGYGALMVWIFRSRVALRADSIEVTRVLWPSRRVARTDIVARRMHPSGWRSAPYHILITRDGREVSLPPYLEHNAALRSWLANIPLASSLS